MTKKEQLEYAQRISQEIDNLINVVQSMVVDIKTDHEKEQFFDRVEWSQKGLEKMRKQ